MATDAELTDELQKCLENFRFLIQMERATLAPIPETDRCFQAIRALLLALGRKS